jgi:hypothetical protein
MILADLQAQRRLGCLIDKNSKALIVIGDNGANQGKLRTLDP